MPVNPAVLTAEKWHPNLRANSLTSWQKGAGQARQFETHRICEHASTEACSYTISKPLAGNYSQVRSVHFAIPLSPTNPHAELFPPCQDPIASTVVRGIRA
jgi:hypothetical protein